jgi:radical SAM protein with 4Fe4S-binding SPASM domain
LYQELPRLLRDARRIGFDSVEVYTNGTSLSQMVRDSLVIENVDLAFSVYGSHPQVHDAVTGMHGSFEKTLKSIRWALEKGLDVRASIIEMPSNESDIGATKALLRRLGVKSVYVDLVRAVGRGNGRASSKGHDPREELCGQCWRGKLAIDPSGNVFPCVFARFCQVGHVSQSLASILSSERLYIFRKEVWKMNKPKKKTQGRKCAPDKRCAPDKPKCAPDRPKCAPDKR